MGIGYAPAGAVEYEAVVAAFDSATAKLACGERGKAMGATVEQRGDSGLASEQDKRSVEQCSRHRTGVELIGPGGLVPAVAKIERRISCGSLVMRVATCHVHFLSYSVSFLKVRNQKRACTVDHRRRFARHRLY